MQHLIDKVAHTIESADDIDLPGGTVAKLYGVTSFLNSGMFSLVGRAGGTEITQSLAKAFSMLKDLPGP